jgi:hypothetical protein
VLDCFKDWAAMSVEFQVFAAFMLCIITACSIATLILVGDMYDKFFNRK